MFAFVLVVICFCLFPGDVNSSAPDSCSSDSCNDESFNLTGIPQFEITLFNYLILLC